LKLLGGRIGQKNASRKKPGKKKQKATKLRRDLQNRPGTVTVGGEII